jgi:hypothetical protein
MKENTTDRSQHRIMISHALKNEPSQMKNIFNNLVRTEIAKRMEVRRAEVGANLFGGKTN